MALTGRKEILNTMIDDSNTSRGNFGFRIIEGRLIEDLRYVKLILPENFKTYNMYVLIKENAIHLCIQ